jgi:hypothetical protein
MGAITCQVRAAGDGSVIGLSPLEAVSLKTSATTPFRQHPPAKVRAFIDFCVEIAEGLEHAAPREVGDFGVGSGAVFEAQLSLPVSTWQIG